MSIITITRITYKQIGTMIVYDELDNHDALNITVHLNHHTYHSLYLLFTSR